MEIPASLDQWTIKLKRARLGGNNAFAKLFGQDILVPLQTRGTCVLTVMLGSEESFFLFFFKLIS